MPQQRLDRLRAGQLRARSHGEREVRRYPQHVRLAFGFEVLAQLGAVAVHLVPAVEVRPDAVVGGILADVDGQLAVAVALQRQQDTGSDLDAGLIPITVPELLRLLCDILIPPPRPGETGHTGCTG